MVKQKRYFEQKIPSGNSNEGHRPTSNDGTLDVFEGGLAKKKKRTKHMLERKKQKDNLEKIAKLSKNENVQIINRAKDNKSDSTVIKRYAPKDGLQESYSSIPAEKLQVYNRGTGVDGAGIKTKLDKKKLLQKEKAVQWASELAARTEILLTEDTGCLEADDGEVTRQYTQTEIVKNVDITSATKSFDLHLQKFGPYRFDYTRNGRYLALGGKRGHVAAFDWITKKLMCEINVVEDIFDIQWLHNETMMAVAQKEWVYIYDRQGVELHCLKAMNRVLRLQFLPYHFLLSSAHEDGWLSWLDVSIGKMITRTSSHCGRPSTMVQNPYNAVLCLGSSKGVVSMWSPSVEKPLAKMLCHKMTVQGLAIDSNGLYMATSAPDHSVKIWDIRYLDGPLQHYKLRSSATNLTFSQKGLLGIAMGNIVEIFKDCCTTAVEKPYLRHCLTHPVSDIHFCPYEDVLGIGTRGGYQSILVPGSGEPNFDAFEANPFQTKQQRREAEVKSLLEKIQPDMITLDPTTITQVNLPTLRDKVEAKKQLLFVKPPKIDFTPRMRKKHHGNTVRMARSKQIVRAEAKQDFLRAMTRVQKEHATDGIEKEESSEPKSVLDRFKQTKKKKKMKSFAP